MTQPKVVILGGGYAGLMAASRVARGASARITLIDRKPHFEQRIRLHQALTGEPLAQGDLRRWLAPANVEFVADTVHTILPEQRRIEMEGGVIDYDFLIIALGSQIARHRIPGAREHAHSLMTQQQSLHLGAAIAQVASNQGHVVLIGGGLTQIETAAELAEHFPSLRLSLLCSGNPFTSFSTPAEHYFREHLRRARIELLEGCTALAIDAGACETSQGRLPFDLCMSAPGFVASPLLQTLGDTLDASGRLAVLPTLQTLHDERIFVAGDSASCQWSGAAPLRMACAVAMPTGAQAGANVAALIQGKAPADLSFGYYFRCISLGRKAGVVQMTHRDDSARSRVFTGRQGAWIKEQVCRMTFQIPRWELRTGLRLYRWPAAGNAGVTAPPRPADYSAEGPQ